jgi:hypothetical protein
VSQSEIIPGLLPVGLTLLQSTSRGLRYEVVTALLAAVSGGKAGALAGNVLAMVEGNTPRPPLPGVTWVNQEDALAESDLREWLADVPGLRLVIVEPLLHFDRHAGSETLWRLKRLAEQHGLAVVVGQQVRRLSGEGVWGPLAAKLTTDGERLRVFLRDREEQIIPLKTRTAKE